MTAVHRGACDDSDFCGEFAGSQATPFAATYPDQPGRILASTETVSVLVDLAPLVPGHVLVVPHQHVMAFGHLDETAWTHAIALRDRAVRAVTDAFGPTVIVEHGSDVHRGSGSCVEHAHWHVLPLPDPRALLSTVAGDGLGGEQVEDLRGRLRTLAVEEERSYIYIGDLHDPAKPSHYVFDEGLPMGHRYVRRALEATIGDGSAQADWALYQNRDYFQATVDALRKAEWE